MLLAQFTSNVLNTDTAISLAGNLHQSNIVITSASQAILISTVNVHQRLCTLMFCFVMVFQLYYILLITLFMLLFKITCDNV